MLQPAASSAEDVFAPNAVANAPAIAQVNPKGHVRTDGEKKFDRLTYTTIGYIANALLSVAAVYWVERTHGGQRWLNNRIEWAQNTFKNLNPENAKMLATKTFFLAGGFAVMLPMKWLENAKVKLVKKWDRQIYGNDVDTDPYIIKSHQELEAAPKQNWASIIGSRIMALIPFYILVGALWDNKSRLSKWTNPELKGMSKKAMNAAEELNASGFAKTASKGVYFDHPIATASRYIGKKLAQLRGKKEVVAQIEKAEKEFPGMMTHPKFGEEKTHDPNHAAVPYYFISEAITSGVVAWGVYVLTRILGPILGTKKQAAPEVAEVKTESPSIESHPVVEANKLTHEKAHDTHHAPHEEHHAHAPKHPHTAADVKEQPEEKTSEKKRELPESKPDTKVHADTLQHHHTHHAEAAHAHGAH